MATLRELRGERLKKLEKLHELGINPYPAHTEATINPNTPALISDVIKDFDKLNGNDVEIVGRLVGIRIHGKIAFLSVKEQWETIQIFLEPGILDQAKYGNSELTFSTRS